MPGNGVGIILGTDVGPVHDTTVLIDRCTFRNCSNYDGDPRPTRLGGVVYGDSVAHVGLRNYTFEGTVGADVGVSDGGVTVYANPRIDVYHGLARRYQQSIGMRAFWLPGPARRQNSPWVNTTADDPGFVKIERSLARAQQRAAAGTGGGLSGAVVAGIVVACVAAVALCIAAVACAAYFPKRKVHQGTTAASSQSKRASQVRHAPISTVLIAASGEVALLALVICFC